MFQAQVKQSWINVRWFSLSKFIFKYILQFQIDVTYKIEESKNSQEPIGKNGFSYKLGVIKID
jgi:hypothetical protein